MPRNIAYILYSPPIEERLVKICLGSLRKHNSFCEIVLFTYGVGFLKRVFWGNRWRCKVVALGKKEFVDRILFCKIEKLKSLDLDAGDNVLVLDVDLFFKADPFSVFEEDFDVFATSRYYRYPQPINSGVWGYKHNENSKKFIDFF